MPNHNNTLAPALSVPGEPTSRIPRYLLIALAITGGHTICSTAMVLLPAIAPAVAAEYGVDASLIGYQIAIMGVGLLMGLLLFGTLSHRLGACRVVQLGQSLIAIGLLVMLFPFVGVLVPGSFSIGAGFGLLGPSNSTLLMRFTPEHRRNVVFSIQQTSVPFGGVIAGLMGPILAVSFGWRWALAITAALIMTSISLLQLVRARWDSDRDPTAPMIARNPFAGLVTNWSERRLRLLSIAGAAFTWAQFCVAGFTVVTCVEVFGMDLVAAGIVLMVVNICTAMGRVIAGWLADWLGSAARVLYWTGWIMLATCVSMLWISPSWSTPSIYVVFSILGITSCAWSGLVLAEVGHYAPGGNVALVTSGTLTYTNIGKLLGPMVFAAIYAITRSYGIAFATVGVQAIIAIVCLNLLQRGVEK